jgi:hypothetical protein
MLGGGGRRKIGGVVRKASCQHNKHTKCTLRNKGGEGGITRIDYV